MSDAATERTLTALLEAIQTPISESEPAGVDVTYEDSFQQLKGQVNEIGSASGGADYERMIDLASRILTDQSKDLNAACYLAIAKSRMEGWHGVAEGFGAVRTLSEAFWEDLYPVKRRMAARRNAIQFLVERLGDWMELNLPSPQDRDNVVWATEEVEALQEFAAAEMGDEAPAFSLVLRILRDHLRKLPDPEAAAAEAQAAPAGGDGEAAGSVDGVAPSSTSVPPAQGVGEITSEDDVARAIVKSAAFLRAQNAYSASAFRLVRLLRFGDLTDLPPTEGNKTFMEGPTSQRREALDGMLQRGEFPDLLPAVEEAFLEVPLHFWLDLQRLAATALGGLGAPARPAYEAVVAESLSLYQRLPGIVKLTFADGTPFASPITQSWFEELSAATGASGDVPVGEIDEDLEEDLTTAKRLADEGKLADAMRALSPVGLTRRAAFQRRLHSADICFKAGRPEVARPILEDLDHQVEVHGLEGWEPGLVLRLLHHLLRCHEALESAAPDHEKAAWGDRRQAVFQRICRLDPAAGVA